MKIKKVIIDRVRNLLSKNDKDLSIPNNNSNKIETELLSDRPNFKLYAAEQHMNNLKDIEKRYGTIMGKGRIYAEMEIDCFFAQIMGAKDSLLVQINEKLKLGLPIDMVELGLINNKLNSINKGNLLEGLNKITQKDSWLWLLNELRNHSMHRKMLNKQVKVGLYENVNTNTSSSSKPEVYFLVNPRDEKKAPMDKPVILYLQESLQNMKDMIGNMRNKDTLLKQ
jgi:hypothetical protein